MPEQRERDAIELLDRIYGRKADRLLADADMYESWVDEQIMAFIRKHGSFPDQLRDTERAAGRLVEAERLLREYGSCDPYSGQPYDEVVRFLADA